VTSTPTRREQILATAAELFAARGFHGVSVADLGAACGISGPALYKHFTSKPAMLAEMLIAISEQLLSVGQQRVAAAAGDPAGALYGLIDWHIEFALGHRALIIVQDRDWSSLPTDAREQVRRLQRKYVELWTDQLRALDPELSKAAAHASAQAVFGLLNSTPRAGHAISDADLRSLLTTLAERALSLPS
jgi:AcrR family transcriptional regulator